jgi:AcrR family transcriptional regulator
MNMSSPRKRSYASRLRADSAEDTRRRILAAAKNLFARKGIDPVTIADIGDKADVAASTIYAIFKSKTGILKALMEQSLFGEAFQKAQGILEGISDPVELIALTPHVSRAIYESEVTDLGILRSSAAFSPELRKAEDAFEKTRYQMQEKRIISLFESGKQNKALSIEEARRVLWMYTSRDVYRMLVFNGGWTPEQYQAWLSRTLLDALVDPRRYSRKG